MEFAVVALGKVGLTIAVQIASKGHRVAGCDVNADVVTAVNAGIAPFAGERGLADHLRDVVTSGALTATNDTTAAVRSCDTVIVLVPLLVDSSGRPEFDALDRATSAIAAGVQPGTLVVYETTLPVGTTRNRFAVDLANQSGLSLGTDLLVAFSPERVRSGTIFADLRRYPKLVGGVDDASTARAVATYEQIIDFDPRHDLRRGNGVWAMASAEEAELAKLVDTTYRDVNIALANEFAQHADELGVDIGDVIDAANSQLQAHILQPGIAVGGHCIPVYPHLYLAGHPDARIPALARAVNKGMPAYAVGRLADSVGGLNGRRVAVLGLAYRGGVKETAFSGAFGVLEAVSRHGGEGVVHDPLYTDAEIAGFDLRPYHLGEPCDAAVIQADHEEYAGLRPNDLPGVKALLDGRGITRAEDWLGVTHLRLGS